MPRAVRVVPEDLTVSAAHVDAHADNLRQRHGAADAQIEGAQAGLPAGAATALSGAVAKWQQVTAARYTTMASHSARLRSGATSYAEVDTSSAEALDAAGRSVPTLDVGL